MSKYVIDSSTLTSIADAIRQKGGTSSPMNPSQMVAAIGNIQTGVTVQRRSGSLTTNASGTTSVACGFKPDLIYLSMNENYGGKHYSTALALAEDGRSGEHQIILYAVAEGDIYYLYDVVISATGSGFSVEITKMDYEYQYTPAAYLTLQYAAVKYTE